MSRAQRRREQRAARREAESQATRQVLREREERKRARDLPADQKPLPIRILRFVWSLIVAEEKRDFWRAAGIMALIGRGMGIDTRDPRLPAWTGLNESPGAPSGGDKAKKEPRP